MTKIITVFGGSQPQPGSDAYRSALELGRLLADNRFIVMTGGYIGTMEAISRGAADAGGHVIGVTCDEIESWRPVTPNRWVVEERRYGRLRERLYALIDECEAAIALPGGIGTLAEIAVMWSQMQTGATQKKPLVLLGDGWHVSFQALYEQMEPYIRQDDRELIAFVPDAPAAVDHLMKVL
jgi:hypothetical protein